MSTLVTGGAGFIGRHVVGLLLDQGTCVRVFDDLSRAHKDSLDAFAGRRNFLGLVTGDVSDLDSLDRGLGGVDTIIHLAAAVDVGASVCSPVESIRANVIGTLNVLEAARIGQLRLILVSTCHVYASAQEPITEQSATAPVSPYAASKLAADDLACAYERAYGVRVTIVRPFNVYGPWQREDLEGGVVARFIKSALIGKPLDVHGDGSQTRDFVFVDDVARGIVAAADETVVGRTIILASSHETTILELATLINVGAGGVRSVPHPHPQAEVNRYVGDATLAKDLLGWDATVTLVTGVDRTKEWYAARGLS